MTHEVVAVRSNTHVVDRAPASLGGYAAVDDGLDIATDSRLQFVPIALLFNPLLSGSILLLPESRHQRQFVEVNGTSTDGGFDTHFAVSSLAAPSLHKVEWKLTMTCTDLARCSSSSYMPQASSTSESSLDARRASCEVCWLCILSRNKDAMSTGIICRCA